MIPASEMALQVESEVESEDEGLSGEGDSSSDNDSDTQLQNAFSRGDLKPGLNLMTEKTEKIYKNNEGGLKQKLQEFKLNLPWIETLDLQNEPASLAPEIALEIEEHAKARRRTMSSKDSKFNVDEDVVHNDFKREMMFYRQAQSAVLIGITKLHKLGIPTKRPEDYFAQMAKGDDHMQKVRKKLMAKDMSQKLSEHAKKLRELKKYGKKVQVEVQQQRAKEKRDMLDKISKFRKGKSAGIDFLDDGPMRDTEHGNDHKNLKKMKKDIARSKGKQNFKDKKYGHGGKKKGTKRNTADSFADSSLPIMRKPGSKFKGNKFGGSKTGGKGGKKSSGGTSLRPGKNRRKQMKNKNK